MLVILGGLPGVGKTAIATGLARSIGAVHLRIDSIEQALRNASVVLAGPEGYEVAYAVAGDNLRLGRTVIADSVNPIELTRAAWRQVAQRAGRRYAEIEIVCSDWSEHRGRVESRLSDIAGHQLPTWQQVRERAYEPWQADFVVDTAGLPMETGVSAIKQRLAELGVPIPASASAGQKDGP